MLLWKEDCAAEFTATGYTQQLPYAHLDHDGLLFGEVGLGREADELDGTAARRASWPSAA